MAAGGVNDPEAGTVSPSRLKVALALVGWLVACFAAASLGAIFMPGEWYLALNEEASQDGRISMALAWLVMSATAGCAMRRSAVMAWKRIRQLFAWPIAWKP